MSNPFIPVETAKPPKVNSPASLAEISHAFLEANDLVNRWLALCPQKYFCIGETGFGNALNFLSTWHAWLRYAPEEAILYYYSCEKHPLKAGDLKNYLEQWSEFDALAGELVKQYPVLTPGFHFLSLSNGRVRLILMLGEASSCFQQLLCSGDLKLDSNLECAQFDAWYLPGNSETLTQDLFKTIALLSRPGCTFAGFLEENAVKDNLHNCGFRINQQKQMPAGEFLEARYSASRRITAWHASVKREFKEKKAIIVGAGLAGAMTACALAKRGWEVRLIEQRASHAQGASGNSQAILYPQLSAFKSPLTDFMLMAYLYAVRFYQQIPSINDFADLSGILQVAYSGKERKLQSSLNNWLVLYPELASLINANEASLKAGIALSEGGLFIPASGWIDIPQLCGSLLQHPQIEIYANSTVSEINHENGQWFTNNLQADVLVLANGYQAGEFTPTQWLPLKRIKGQMTWIDQSTESSALKRPICGEGHVLPARNGLHALGATYELQFDHLDTNERANQVNLQKLDQLAGNINWHRAAKDQWAGIRTAAPDYLPVVGPVPDKPLFQQRFARLVDDSKRWLAVEGAFLPGLYICAGFGSRGLTSVPVCAEWLASVINNEPGFMPRDIVRALSAGRFLIKDIVLGKNGNAGQKMDVTFK